MARMRLLLLLAWLVPCAVGCGGRRHDAAPDAGHARDAAAGRDAGDGRDAAPDAEVDDAGAPTCDCAAGVPVGMFRPCTPPLEMGCPIQTCTPGGDECPEGDTCEECGAAACCECAACVPACIHTVGSPGDAMPELLKLGTVYGPAGRPGELTIEGAPFYVGALGYSVRVGDLAGGDLPQSGGAECTLRATAPAAPAGTMLPVWVSQYGFGEPWVLAGFFSWIDGDDPPSCTQPGLACDADRPCCETGEVPMSCQGGRCRRE